MNASSFESAPDRQSLTLTGNGALDRTTMTPSARAARVVYRIDPITRTLTREQRYLDDDVRPEPWAEMVATGVHRLSITLPPGDLVVDATGRRMIPARATISIKRDAGDISTEVHPR